jgi:hypothetical protein
MNMDFLSKIEKLLDQDPLKITMVEDVFHEAMLENAVDAVQNDAHDRAMPYVEEFLRNAVFLLELDAEPDARFQLEAAKAILTRS